MTVPAWFDNLQSRERWTLLIGASVAVLIGFWALAWNPLALSTDRLGNSVIAKQQLLVALQRVEALPTAAPAVSRADEPSLLVLIERTQRTHGLGEAVTRTRPIDGDGINVAFQNAPFDALLAWLIALQAEYGVGVETASFDGTRQPGLVTGQVSLRRS